ncbi:MAG: peptidoglycan-associated lipoprotein Pal [Gammaproteobacteria bacterium]|nr:peptidoglycan-associated lipoprotein Pal [Gammaproteobacteria bacterium]
MIKTMNRWLLATLVLAMAACASTKQSGDDVPIEDRQPSEFSTENGGDGFSVNGIGDNGDVIGSETSGIGSEGAASLAALEDPDSPLAERIIYFAVDSNVIGNEYTAMIEAHARFLAENPDVNAILEGHTDESGTREYNLALGERRAKSVRDFLLLQGASSSQIETISYGEERPAQFGQDGTSWDQNRRVEILYGNR